MEENNLEIIFEDEYIIAINKKPLSQSQKDKTSEDVALLDEVEKHLNKRDRKKYFIGLIHRLDRRVGGVVMFAKSKESLLAFNKMIGASELIKKYWAIVRNKPEDNENTLKHYLVHNKKSDKAFYYLEPISEAKEAITKFKLISNSEKFFLLELEPLTGRQHQIRAQLAAIGSPIKGDLKYGDKRSNLDGSISLHARKISFKHPITGNNINIEAPVPKDNLWLFFEENNK